jgi:hypothetical protein
MELGSRAHLLQQRQDILPVDLEAIPDAHVSLTLSVTKSR